MKRALFWFTVLLLVFLEGTFSSVPLFLDGIILGYVFTKDTYIVWGACVGGIILDILLFQTLGISSIFFLCILFVFLLYEKKFEIKTVPFVFVSTFLSTILFFQFFGERIFFTQSLVNAIFTGFIAFIILRKQKGQQMLYSSS